MSEDSQSVSVVFCEEHLQDILAQASLQSPELMQPLDCLFDGFVREE
jgi:hypothetical protein